MDTSENIKTIKTDDVNREVSYMQTRRQDQKNEPLLPLRFAFLKSKSELFQPTSSLLLHFVQFLIYRRFFWS